MNIPNRKSNLKNRTNYFTAMTFSFTPDAKLINVKIPTNLIYG
jgi:hypothetical protein